MACCSSDVAEELECPSDAVRSEQHILELTEALFADKDFRGRIEHRHSTAVFAIFGVGHVGGPEFERGLVPDIGDPTSVGIGADLLAADLRLDAIVER